MIFSTLAAQNAFVERKTLSREFTKIPAVELFNFLSQW